MQRRDALKAIVGATMLPSTVLAGQWKSSTSKNHKWQPISVVTSLSSEAIELSQKDIDQADASVFQMSLRLSSMDELVMFSPKWCTACAKLKESMVPWLEASNWLVQTDNFMVANDLTITTNEEFAKLHGITEYPTFAVFHAGEIIDQYSGINQRAILRMMVPTYDPYKDYTVKVADVHESVGHKLHLIRDHKVPKDEVERMTKGEMYMTHDKLHENTPVQNSQQQYHQHSNQGRVRRRWGLFSRG